MKLYIIIIIIVVILYYNYDSCIEKFTEYTRGVSDYNYGLNEITKDKLLNHNVIPSEYRTYLLDTLRKVFAELRNREGERITYIPYEIIETVSENNILRVYFFANSRNGFNSLVFRADFNIGNDKLDLLNIHIKSINDSYGTKEVVSNVNNDVYGINTFQIIYPSENIEKIDLDGIVGIMNDTVSQCAKITYKIDPIIKADLLRVNLPPGMEMPDLFRGYPNWDDEALPSTTLQITNPDLFKGNNYIPGMFRINTSSKSMFSKLFDIPSFPFGLGFPTNCGC